MKSKKFWLVLVSVFLLGLALIAGGCGKSTGNSEGNQDSQTAEQQPAAEKQPAKNITIKGSDTMVVLGQRWAEEYMNNNPEVVIQVTGGGSGTGIAALINGTTTIAEASRPMKEKEIQEAEAKQGKKVQEIATALDGVAVYLNVKNQVKELTMAQLKDIYTGKVSNWKDVGGQDAKIVLYGRENNSGTYVFFKEHVLENEDYAATTQTLPGTAAVVNAVDKDENGVGYGGIAYAKGIKFVNAKKDADTQGVSPSLETVRSGEYPLARKLYWYTFENPTPEVQALIDWVLGADGQKLVEEVGYFPLN